ncbi:ankyrin repeat-containing domain protein [Baffinella frigidus]|nr:ankyrin repeat-containing domain protein [Cryptophyta sp. CCMP2293]
MTPLLQATHRGRHQMVTLLLANGADVNAKCSFGHSALHYSRHWQITRTLLQAGCDTTPKVNGGKTALHYAVLHGYAELVRTLLRHADIAATDDEGYNVLHWAVQLHSIECDHEDRRESRATTPNLHRFFRYTKGSDRSAAVVRILLEHGSVYNKHTHLTAVTVFGETPEDSLV